MKVMDWLINSFISSSRESMWWRDSSGKEMKSMRCSVTSRQVVAPNMHFYCHLQKKHMTANKPLYMTSIDLKKAFDQVPRDVVWRAVHKLRIEQWLVHLVQFIYKDVRSREKVVRSFILEWMFIRALPEFEFGVDVYQGSVLNSLLLIIV